MKLCRDNGIKHRFTEILHPWTNGQVERRSRAIKDAAVKRCHSDSHDQLERHLVDVVSACNFGRRLKTLKGLTPYEAICNRRASEPERFTLDPIHQMPELTIWHFGFASAFPRIAFHFPGRCSEAARNHGSLQAHPLFK
ncbi:hypothetical protein BOSEA31B_10117 [Hyphomicrobiales bacterium]|nr:hypothetical protein BOSEA31B_10117 [Hyphomicrobiales bacterium]CAH1701797.1 hypothetical protein BOSEA1005_21496 [Hyphomicrobiales bacterium]CAI0345952.1 hypothetical protein BO1005MUT1_470110 [Hyphomicrobiales bacterium]